MAIPATPPEKMSFWEHLQELRVRIVRSLLIVAGAFAFTYGFPFGYRDIPPLRFKLWAWAQKPFMEAMAAQTHKPISELQPFAFTDLTEPFFSMMRLSLWAAAFVAAPFLFYQLWAFIRPGLLPKERRLVIPFVVVTSGCFLLGSAFAYTQAFKFLGDILFQEAAAAGLRANLHASDYLDLFISTTLITGIMFELPVLFFFLARFRIVTARWMLKYWRHATMVILIFSAFFTPGDVVVTTIFFSIVLLGLYFISVAVAWLAEPRQPR
ncbi:MAG: twin-arginine translocase subunit TatC [Geothrix sp.]|uniref:twin-arginine translocase subunit TatC n=1 Tax=Geothrix sp. TaxID=1962974 RepID=UPI0017F6BBD5|nr:twin-arginine translocase subunit TatC [Geothrix sp.]NWJ40032.1 twin-arginine translocase subunit TatC [Geothrix sp.]WIL21959.1 MAG: twin-arginine translocase subunit TatC [Geothrix sp.]